MADTQSDIAIKVHLKLSQGNGLETSLQQQVDGLYAQIQLEKVK